MQAGSDSFSPYMLVLFLAIGFTFMGLICFLMAVFSGWYSLAKRFTAQSEPYGQTKSAGPFSYTVYMRFWGHYSSVIRITAADDGLYLAVIFPFRLGHPPLSIPWKEIQLSRTTFFWRRYVVFTLGNEERIPLRISPRMARNLGILDRIPGGSALEVEPNFDRLPDDFPDPTAKKPI